MPCSYSATKHHWSNEIRRVTCYEVSTDLELGGLNLGSIHSGPGHGGSHKLRVLPPSKEIQETRQAPWRCTCKCVLLLSKHCGHKTDSKLYGVVQQCNSGINKITWEKPHPAQNKYWNQRNVRRSTYTGLCLYLMGDKVSTMNVNVTRCASVIGSREIKLWKPPCRDAKDDVMVTLRWCYYVNVMTSWMAFQWHFNDVMMQSAVALAVQKKTPPPGDVHWHGTKQNIKHTKTYY